MENIKLTTVLKELDYKITPQGKQVIFSIKFYNKKGEVVYFHKAISTGAKFNLKDNAMRVFMPVDSEGEKIDHPHPVSIWMLREFNGQKITMR